MTQYITLYAQDKDENMYIVIFSGVVDPKIEWESKTQPGEKIEVLKADFIVIFTIGNKHFPSYPRYNLLRGWNYNGHDAKFLRIYRFKEGWKNGKIESSRIEKILLPYYPRLNENKAKEIIETLENKLPIHKDDNLENAIKGLHFISNLKQFFKISIKDEYENKDVATVDRKLQLLEEVLYARNIYMRKKLLDEFIKLKPEEGLVKRIVESGSEELISGLFLQSAYLHYFPDYMKKNAESAIKGDFSWTLSDFAQGIKRTIKLYLYVANNARSNATSEPQDKDEKLARDKIERIKNELLSKLEIIDNFYPTLMNVYRISKMKLVGYSYHSYISRKRIEKATKEYMNISLEPKFLKRIKEIDNQERDFRNYAEWQRKVIEPYLYILISYLIKETPPGEEYFDLIQKGDFFINDIFIYIKDIFQKAVALDLPEVVGKCAYYYDTLLAKQIANELDYRRGYYYFRKLYLRQIKKYSKDNYKFLKFLRGFLSGYRDRDYLPRIQYKKEFYTLNKHYILKDVILDYKSLIFNNINYIIDQLPEIKLNFILNYIANHLKRMSNIDEIIEAKDTISLIKLANSTNNLISEIFGDYLKKRINSETEFNPDYLIELMEMDSLQGQGLVELYFNKFRPKCTGYLLYRYFLMENKKYWMQEDRIINNHLKAATEEDVFNFINRLLGNFAELYRDSKKGKIKGYINTEDMEIFNNLISENIFKFESDNLDMLIKEILEIIIFMITEHLKNGTFKLSINLRAGTSEPNLDEEENIYEFNKFLSDLYVFFLNILFSLDLTELKKLKEKYPIVFKELEELGESHFIEDESSRNLIYFLSALNSNRIPPSHVIKSILFKGLTNIKNKMVEYLNLNIDKWIKDPYIVLQCLEVGISSLIDSIDKHFEEIPDEIETDAGISRHALGKRAQLLFLILDSPVRSAFEFGLRKLEKLYSPIDKDLTTKEVKEAIATKIPYNILIRLLEHPAPEVKSWLSGRFHDLINNIEKYIDDSDEIRLQRSIDLFLYYTKTIIYFPNRFSKERLNVYDALYRLALKYKENKEIINKIQNTLLEAGASNVQVNSDNALLTLAKILEVIEK